MGKFNKYRGSIRIAFGIWSCVLAADWVLGQEQDSGLSGEIEMVQLVSTNSPYAFFKGLELPSDPLLAWTEVGFDDSSWGEKLWTPFSYGEGHNFGTVLEDMQGNYSSFMLRHSFQVEEAAKITELKITAAIDDGFIAWVNGREVLRVNVADGPFAVAVTASTVPEPIPFVSYDVPVDLGDLIAGQNILAVQVVNGNLVSSDIFFEIQVDGVLGERNVQPLRIDVEPALEPKVVDIFSEGESWRFFRGRQEPGASATSWQEPEFDDSDWEFGSSPFFYGENVSGGTALPDMQNGYSTVYLRRTFFVAEEDLGRTVAAQVRVDDGVALWINGQELGRAAVDFGDLLFDTDATFSAVEPLEPILFAGEPDLLRAGENTIAVLGVNSSIASSDFFIDLKLGIIKRLIVPSGAVWRYAPLVDGFQEGGGGDWASVEFDDSNWELGVAPFQSLDSGLGGTVVGPLLDENPSLLLRRTFQLDHPNRLKTIEVDLEVAHGAVLWLNGVEIYRHNLAEGVLSDRVQSLTPLENALSTVVPIAVPGGLLQRGQNVLAVRAVNHGDATEGFTFDLAMESDGADVTPPQLVDVRPSVARLSSLGEIALTFNENVRGLNAGDLTVNGIPAKGILRRDRERIFLVDEPSEWPAVVVFQPQGPVLDLAPEPNFLAYARTEWMYELEDTIAPELVAIQPIPNSRVASLAQLELTFSEAIDLPSSAILMLNGVPVSDVAMPGPNRLRFSLGAPVDGAVEIGLIEGTGVQDLAGNHWVSSDVWRYELDSGLGSQLMINEVVTANATGLRDEDLVPSDWIELVNQSDELINLAGWSLSDDPDEPRKWTFPDLGLGPNQYLNVFASGNDRKPSDGGLLHTNFRLARGGEGVFLSPPGLPAVIASQTPDPLPEIRDGVSFGRVAGEQWRYFSRPTPGAPNGNSSLEEVVKPVRFNAPRGLYERPFSLTLIADDPGDTIRFTTDGSDPTEENGTVFEQPFRIQATTIVRTAAFREGALPSEIRTRTFLFSGDTELGDLPVFSLTTASTNLVGPTGILGIGGGEYIPRGNDFVWSPLGPDDYHNPSQKGREWERPISVEYFDQQGDGFQADGGIRVHASSFARPKLRSDSKFGMRLYFRSGYGDTKVTFPLLPEAGFEDYDRVVLRSGHNDSENPFISDELLRRLSARMGRLTSRGNFSHVFLNGVHQGYYNHAERIEISSLQKWFGGDEDWDIIKPFAILSEGDKDEWNEMISFFSSNDLSVPANYIEAARHLDLASFADYILVNIYADTGDWVRSNWRAVREEVPDGLFRFLIWDAEFSFGIYGRPEDRNTLELPGELGIPTFITMIFGQLRQNAEFRLLFADQVQKHFFNRGALTDRSIRETYERTRDEVLSVIPNFRTYIEDRWIPGRRGNMLAHLSAAGLAASESAPSFSQHGGFVSAGFPLLLNRSGGGQILYTLDGSDPRVPFRNEPNASALPYAANPIVLTQSVEVKARTFDNGVWSALTEASFSVGAADSGVSITELNYNPVSGGTPEFVELLNRSASPNDLSGASFSGIDFTFPSGSVVEPGGVWVLVKAGEEDRFAVHHATVPIAGLFEGKLSNKGESIRLESPQGALLAAVRYDDEDGWPLEADGSGKSLELRRLESDPNDATQWRASFEVGGSPGEFVSEAPSPVRLGEVFAAVRTALGEESFVELENMGSDPVDISGWTLGGLDTDDVVLQFETGTVLLGAGRLAIAASSLHPREDTLVLRSGDGSILDSIRYGDQVPGFSLVRTGESTWSLGMPSRGVENVEADLALSESLRINEWMANPLPGDDDWFEIYNRDEVRPAALSGLTFSDGDTLATLRSLVFVPAGGFVRIWADDGRGPDHLPFRLSGAGGEIAVFDHRSQLIDSVSYPAQAEGRSGGRQADGSEVILASLTEPTPGASNQLTGAGDLYLTEILWRNIDAIESPEGASGSFIELGNRGTGSLVLDGYSLRLRGQERREWDFPLGIVIEPGSRLVVWIDPVLPDSGADHLFFPTGEQRSLSGGRVELVNSGLVVEDSLRFGLQVPDFSLGRTELGWELQGSPSPGNEETGALTLAPGRGIRVNEWRASSTDGVDWIELYHSGEGIVDLGGFLLTDDPGSIGFGGTLIAPLTFLQQGTFVTFGDSGRFDPASPTELDFSLARDGEFIRLYDREGELVDAIDFGAQLTNRTEGRLPDGADVIVSGLGPTPNAANEIGLPLDSDADGLPDEWELANGLDPFDASDAALDSDFDGINNLTEFLEGSNPNDSIGPILGSIRFGEDALVLRFEVRSDSRYLLQSKSDITSLEWFTEMDVMTGVDEDFVEFVVELNGESAIRFFRLVEP